MLNELSAAPTSNFQPVRLLDPRLIEIHIFNDKTVQIQTSLAFSEADWSGATLFAKTGHVVFSKRSIKEDVSIWRNTTAEIYKNERAHDVSNVRTIYWHGFLDSW